MIGNPYYSGWKCEHRFDKLREKLNVKIGGLYSIHNDDKKISELNTINYNINKIKFFRDIPDGIKILVDYLDVAAVRTMNTPTEIIYESIYRELPELFEE